MNDRIVCAVIIRYKYFNALRMYEVYVVLLRQIHHTMHFLLKIYIYQYIRGSSLIYPNLFISQKIVSQK